jgi:hypothetical protein
MRDDDPDEIGTCLEGFITTMSSAREAARGGRRRRKSARHTPDSKPHLVLVSSSEERRTEPVTVHEFCAHVKAARERRGVSLTSIAERTKITVSLFDALERGDLSRWPKGIYRRAFFRDYVSAIGLPVEPTVREFLRHFPDEDEDALTTRGARQEETATLLRRLTAWFRPKR